MVNPLKMNISKAFSFLCAFFVISSSAWGLPHALSGKSALDGHAVEAGQNAKKGLIVIFLSAVCPCSHSHLVELKNLYKEYPDFEFVGIHSNVDEGADLTAKYFKGMELPFPVLQDDKATWADEFKALKTPHVFVVLNDGSVAYKGGISSSRHFDDKTDRKYLREALVDLAAGQKVRTPEGRTLGCTISRGEKNVW